jgi:hypothetical protein
MFALLTTQVEAIFDAKGSTVCVQSCQGRGLSAGSPAECMAVPAGCFLGCLCYLGGGGIHSRPTPQLAQQVWSWVYPLA